MNIKKIFFIIISVLILGASLILPNVSMAAYDTPIYLGITELRTGSTPNIGYAIGNPNANTSTIVAAKIWNIVKYSTADSTDPTEANFYCVKAGVGFSDTRKKATYDKKYDLKTQRSNIAAQNSVLSDLVNGGYYNHLLALVDMLYIPEESTDAEKTALLEAAGIYEDDWDFALTDDDIEAVQQAAIWYFTNYGDSVYDKYNSTAWLNYTTDGSNYTSLSGYYADEAPNANGNTNSGDQRQSQAEILYKYLIDTAEANKTKYDNASTIGAPITINTKTLNAQTKGDNFIVGPINITKNNDLAYELNLLITNESNTTISNYSLLDENQTATTKTVKELVEQGKDFYLQIPKTAATTINVKINASYKTTTATLYASSTNNEEQPVILVEKETKPIEVSLAVTPDQRIFDLALRKYITKVNGTEVTNSRVPTIDKSTLSTGTTATYKHRKDPVEVQTGNIVTYKLTIYNEGEKAGRATKVEDQLPTGLQFSKVVSGNFEKSSYDETTNKLVLTRKSGNEDNLAAYDVTTQSLSSETIEIECKVIALAKETEQVLTNVAWISEEYDAVEEITITNQSNADRDSEPLTTPSVNKDNMSTYAGNGNKSDLADSTYYYKGQQDDDDFEKLLLPKAVGEYNLKIVKVEKGNESTKLKGAGFKVTLADGTEKNLTTNDSGEINISSINIEKSGTDKIKIEEIKAPTGYKKIISNVEINVTKILSNGKYEATKAELTNAVSGAKVEISGGVITATIEDEKQIFDLALRKYITKVNGTEVTNSRVPTIDKSTLSTGTTATYKHRKDPVEVQTGNIVTYKLTIYNEGEKAGRATKVEDQLPTGLQFSKVVSGNFEKSSYDETTNKLVLTRKSGNEDNLAAYDATTQSLSSETIEIECKVIALAKETEQVLTNVAWISEEYDAVEEITITNQSNADRDSEPLTTPSVNKDNMSTYAGNGNKSDLADSTYYYKGQQDDDDFEKLLLPKAVGEYNLKIVKVEKGNESTKLKGAGFKVTLADGTEKNLTTNDSGEINISSINIEKSGTDKIKIEEIKAPTGYKKIISNVEINVTKILSNGKYEATKAELTNAVSGAKVEISGGVITATLENEKQIFDLALRKYITKVNGTEVTNSRVPTIDKSTLSTGTTATYKHRKDPVEVQTGNIVTYKLTIYNEGEKAGRATKVEDQLPTGLQFSKVVSGNFEKSSYDETTNKLVLTRKSGNEDNLAAYDVTTQSLSSETIEIECKVIALAKETEQVLTNVAWISEEYDAVEEITITNQSNADRDSEPLTTPSVNKDNMSTYAGNGNKSDLADSTYYYKGQQDDDDFEKLLLPKAVGEYNLKIVKVEKGNESTKLKGAGFKVTLADGTEKNLTTNDSGEINISSINIEKSGTDKIKIEEIKAPTGYKKIISNVEINVTKILSNGKYEATKAELTNAVSGAKVEISGGVITATIEDEKKVFDLKLIKRITEVNGETVPERIKSVDVSKLNTLDENGKMITTADYKLTKDPVSVKKGDIVTYTLRIYNEGEIDGYASEITEDIPEGLEFIATLDATKLTEKEKEAVNFNNRYGWVIDKENNKLVRTAYLSKASETITGENLIKAFGENDGSKTEKDISYKEVQIKLKVVADDVIGKVIRNEACISKDSDEEGKDVTDRDSTPEEWKKEPSDKYYDEDKKWPIYKEDDEDYDNIKLQSFDLALRKFIIAVSDDEKIEETEYLKNTNGSYTRAPQVDTSKLNTKDEEGNIITTAIYNHPKTPVEVKRNDYVVYSLRVYNEGELDGYATEITDHLPTYLEFVNGEYNKKYGWEVSEDGRTVKTKYLENSKIKAAEKLPEMVGAYVDEDGNIIGSGGSTGYVLSYVEVPIMCKVTDKAKTNEAITNIADITEFKDENKKDINDRDSEKDNVKLPADDKLPTYKDEEKGTYVPGQEDDDDFEKVIIKRFDLALRKFITEVNENEVTTRIPEIKYDKENNKITYEHTKEPVEVVSSDIVTYTIRVFNEGEVDGYAKEVMDDIPEGLEFLPENETNTEYRWVMYEEVKDEKEVEDASKIIERDGKKYIETKEASKASIITTDYLSKEQGEARMKEDSTIKENPALLTAFDTSKEISETNPDYADVKVAFKVIEPNTSDKIIINSAQISEDSDKNGKDIDDDDSIPGKWNEGEDDQDKEYIKLTYFDLALRKWVTQAIVIEDGKETVTNTGHDAWDDPEEVVKVELNRKKLSKVTVKFKYSIRIFNQGDIAGYAKEITDYVPEGLKFVAEDNPGWTDEGNNVISTRLLENTLLQPGEYADVEVLLTWINGQDNIGLKTNTAEISEDYNDKHAKDIDSTPDNKKPGEDDIDDAPVILSISTGQVRIYFILGFTVLITIAGGIVLIKKYVL